MALPARSPLVVSNSPYALAPYALAPIVFRFPALAAHAGRAPLGGPREVALAAYMVARLADDTRTERGLPREVRLVRATHAKHWLATLALPANVRSSLTTIVEASTGDAPAMARVLREEMTAVASFLDANARVELEELAASLDSRPPRHAPTPASAQALVK